MSHNYRGQCETRVVRLHTDRWADVNNPTGEFNSGKQVTPNSLEMLNRLKTLPGGRQQNGRVERVARGLTSAEPLGFKFAGHLQRASGVSRILSGWQRTSRKLNDGEFV